MGEDRAPPRERLWQIVALVAVLACALVFSNTYLRPYLLAETSPRKVAPRSAFEGEEARTTQLFVKTAPSVVAIYARKGAAVARGGVGTGSGFIWDDAGHIVTNHHVIADATDIGVVIANEQPIPARIVGSAPWIDLAVLRLTQLPHALQPIPVGTSGDLGS